MAATGDEEMESLFSSFDQIYEDVTQCTTEIQSLKLSFNAEVKRREALEITCNSLKSDNERLLKLYIETINKVADQLEQRAKCQSLKEELKKMKAEHLSKQNEHKRAAELLKEEQVRKITYLETQVRCSLQKQVENEATINQLCRDLAAHKNHIEALIKRLEQVHAAVESKYYHEIQDLKDWILVEQEEKNELNKKLLKTEKELLISNTKMGEQRLDLTSHRHVETLKQKIMKLRKENEVLKRQLHTFEDH
ncbi:hypothetical protein NE237_022955 [Protea cynaroides]|uniref:Protein At-4/1-like n=1 Tax=Protea cynaroides TaxID=273540 RepID=A0A9Q0K4P2_9MAGN|nr:hypothetical protein NE237_022955 [Protea cynaroides]